MEWLIELLDKRLSPGWMLGALIVYLVFDQTGIIQRWFHSRKDAKDELERERGSERGLLSEDTHRLIISLQHELVQQRDRHIAEIAYYRDELVRARDEVDEKNHAIIGRDETIALLSRGEGRWRHAFANAATYIATVRTFCRSNSLVPPVYDGWRDVIGMMGDPDAERTLVQLFEDNKP